MLKVFKYPLEILSYHQVELPVGAKVLKFENQNNVPTIWALVDPSPSVPKETRLFRLAGTGHEIDEEHLKFIDTVFINQFVLHFFEVLTERAAPRESCNL